MKLRINKLISEAGLGSRRDAEDYIRSGRVTINGRKATLSDLVEETDTVLFDQVDLPVKELITDHQSTEKVDKNAQVKSAKRGKTKGEERAESQRIKAMPKSAALRKTSKNNPENKRRRAMQEEEDDDFGAYAFRQKDRRRPSSKAPKIWEKAQRLLGSKDIF